MKATCKVLRGLEITVEFDMLPADTSVGIMSESLDDWHIVAVAGKPVKKANWIYQRLTEADESEIERACLEAWNSKEDPEHWWP